MTIRSEKDIGYYKQPKSGREYTSEELIAHWESLVDKYPIISIEDGLDEEDWEGWKLMTERVAKYNQLLRIEEELGEAACYPQMDAFNVKK